MKKIILLVIVLFIQISPQSKDPDIIIKKVKDEFHKIKDYQVDVKIKVDIDFIKVPDSKAVIYYKYPDKTHFESDGFAMLPKEGMDFSPVSFLKGDYTAIYQKEDQIEGHNVSVVKVIPLNEKSDIVLTTLWIDQKNNIIRKVESSTKIGGTFAIELKYDEKVQFKLPAGMIFTFNIDKMNMPKGLSGEVESEKSRMDESTTTTGKVFVNYSNYKVNQGLSDSIFEKKKKNK